MVRGGLWEALLDGTAPVSTFAQGLAKARRLVVLPSRLGTKGSQRAPPSSFLLLVTSGLQATSDGFQANCD